MSPPPERGPRRPPYPEAPAGPAADRLPPRPRADEADVRVPLVPLAPEAFPSPAAYAAAWAAQLAHEQDRLAAAAVGAPHPNDARDQIAPARRARFRAELRARALARRYRIVSPPEWPEQVPVGPPDHVPPDVSGPGDGRSTWAPWYDGVPVAAGAGREAWDAPADQRLRLPPGLPAGQHVALTVRGASMAPLLLDGDVVLVRLGARAARGRVVVAWHEAPGYAAGHVVKLVDRVGGGAVALTSLAPDHPGLAVPDDGRHVLGTVVARWGGTPGR